MAELATASYVLLWALVVILALVVFALARQVGVLHERVAPAGALMPTSGPKVGELTEEMPLTNINGDAVRIGGPDAKGPRRRRRQGRGSANRVSRRQGAKA